MDFYRLESVIQSTPIEELLRAYHSNKEYFLFKIHSFNVGTRIDIVCTNEYKEFVKNWNGYDFQVTNDDDTRGMIGKALVDRIEACNINQRKRVLKIKISL